ncbi:MAG: hypothetical protein KDB22_23965 [Planctomycetales bacterium]|nr:hypothetical protein [Planctomycetales bacterium]
MKLARLGFLPGVGINYDEGFLGTGKKLLVLGESHYARDKGADMKNRQAFTRNQFGSLFEGAEPEAHLRRFVHSVNRILTGKSATSAEAWQSLAFANFVQTFVNVSPHGEEFTEIGTGSIPRPSGAHWDEANKKLPLLLDALKPDCILVLGKTNWDRIQDRGQGKVEGDIWEVGDLKRKKDEFKPRNLYHFKYKGGIAHATWVYHPSWSTESSEKRRAVLMALVS